VANDPFYGVNITKVLPLPPFLYLDLVNSAQILMFMLVVAVAAAAARYRSEPAPTPIDRVEKATGSLRPFLKPGSAILAENTSDIFEFPVSARFVLAPAFVAFSGNYDTVLAFAMKDQPLTDSMVSRKIIWQNTDDRYQYTLSIKP
jgi:hypothetical protein